MKSREELIKEHNRLLEVYEQVKSMLKDYPNVVNIGIGVKESGGVLTGEGCIKIVVKQKVSAQDLDPQAVIPEEVSGVKTDVIIKSDPLKIGVCEEDQDSYRPVKGGIMINNVRNGGGVGDSGTMGCLAKLNSDSSWVLLSNHHVLYGDSGQDNDEIGQPWVGCSWCCKTNVIAKNVNKSTSLDCAIARINSDVAVSNVIADIGNISGAAAVAAVNGERVRKRGSRTGYTSGTISFIDPATKEITISPNAAGGPANDPGGCTNYEAGKTIFAYFGDSGSVVVNDNNEVVALLYSIDASTHTQGFANDILQIQTAMGITLHTSSAEPGRSAASFQREIKGDITIEEVIAGNEWTGTLEEELKKTATGRGIINLFRKHEIELFNLINKCRPVTYVWQRKQGPAYIAAFGRSMKYTDYLIPDKINGVTLPNLLMSMAVVLGEHANENLKSDLEKYAIEVIQLSKRCQTARGFLKLTEEIDHIGAGLILQKN